MIFGRRAPGDPRGCASCGHAEDCHTSTDGGATWACRWQNCPCPSFEATGEPYIIVNPDGTITGVDDDGVSDPVSVGLSMAPWQVKVMQRAFDAAHRGESFVLVRPMEWRR